MFREDGNVLHFSAPKGSSFAPLFPPETRRFSPGHALAPHFCPIRTCTRVPP